MQTATTAGWVLCSLPRGLDKMFCVLITRISLCSGKQDYSQLQTLPLDVSPAVMGEKGKSERGWMDKLIQLLLLHATGIRSEMYFNTKGNY